MKVPLFEEDCCERPMPLRECRRVGICNPWRPEERAEVVLGVDSCGNLVVCVQRLPRRDGCCRPARPEGCVPCPMPPDGPAGPPFRGPASGCGRRRGRLYGNWNA